MRLRKLAASSSSARARIRPDVSLRMPCISAVASFTWLASLLFNSSSPSRMYSV